MQSVLLPDSPALVAEDGVVVQANLAAARLAGRHLPELLIGLSLHSLLVPDTTEADADADLIGPDRRRRPVRVARWQLPGTDIVVIFLVDVSDLCAPVVTSSGNGNGNGNGSPIGIGSVIGSVIGSGIGSAEFDLPVGIAVFDGAHRLVDANDALCQLLGYDLQTLRGLSFDVLAHPAERAELVRTIRTYQAARASSYTMPQRTLLRADGRPVYCELHVSVSPGADERASLLVVFTDVTERRRVVEALKHAATHDDLTGLPNRSGIRKILSEYLAVRHRGLAVLLCDIDGFRLINDAIGHDGGDELLVTLGQRLRAGLPGGCVVGRLFADVYVVIRPDVEGTEGREELVRAVSEVVRTEIRVHGQSVRVSATVAAVLADESTSGPVELLRLAHAALATAKRRRGAPVNRAPRLVVMDRNPRFELECQLRIALVRDELRLYYQPVVGPDGVVLSAEPLLRWQHPERGLLGPEAFLPVAEQAGLVRELDEWVLRSALREARDWIRCPDGEAVSVTVGLVRLVPGEADFLTVMTSAVSDGGGLAWDRVILELAETALRNIPGEGHQVMTELTGRGVRFAVDGFGTGYSSLARLRELPTQIVKLDRRFVAGVGVDPSDFAVARAVVDMARGMRRFCIAEGVETPTQFQMLRSLGMDAYQGSLFSPPVDAEEFRALLTAGPLL